MKIRDKLSLKIRDKGAMTDRWKDEREIWYNILLLMKVFGVEKFKGLLLAGSFTVLANYFGRLSDSVVAGNMLGPDALAGINLVSAILAGVSFFSGLLSSGMATNYSLAMTAKSSTSRTPTRRFPRSARSSSRRSWRSSPGV